MSENIETIDQIDQHYIEGKVICQECGNRFSLITPAHIKTHGMTFAEYKLKYPDAPVSSKAYEAQRFKYKDSQIFKNMEDLPKECLDNDVDINDLKPVTKRTIIDLTDVPKNKADILTYLHECYFTLENNYIVEKFHFYDKQRLMYRFVTDMADPVKKVIFDFPNSFWHNVDAYPDPKRNQKLEDDGWIIITVDKHYPTVNDVEQDTDIICD